MQEYLDQADIAELWGIDPSTVRRYKSLGLLPAPDAVTGTGAGAKPGWLRETIENHHRPGRGARTDLIRREQG